MYETTLWLAHLRAKTIQNHARDGRISHELLSSDLTKSYLAVNGIVPRDYTYAAHERAVQEIPAGLPDDLRRATHDGSSHDRSSGDDNGDENWRDTSDGVPMPIVNLSRWVFTIGPFIGLALASPLIIAILLVIDLLPLLFGRRWSLIGAIGRIIFASRLATAEREDRRIITFNRTLVVLLLACAQVAFWFGVAPAGWFFTIMVAAANGLALAGFCVGCFLYYNLKIYRFRLQRLGWLRAG